MRAMPRQTSLVALGLCLLATPGLAQVGSALFPGISPAPLVRLTGVLEAGDQAGGTGFPVLRVRIADKRWRFRVSRVEPVIPAYRAEEKLRRVSPLGLRFVAEERLLSVLQRPDMRERAIVLEGWLRPGAGVLRLVSVAVAAEP